MPDASASTQKQHSGVAHALTKYQQLSGHAESARRHYHLAKEAFEQATKAVEEAELRQQTAGHELLAEVRLS